MKIPYDFYLRTCIAVVICLSAIGLAYGQAQSIRVEDFTADETFDVQSVYGVRWMKDGRRYTSRKEDRIIAYDITNSQIEEVLFDGKAQDPSLNIDGYTFSEDEQKLLIMTQRQKVYRRSYTAIFYIYDLSTKALTAVDEAPHAYATFSPKGDKVAYVKTNNLYWYDIATGAHTQVTRDGKPNAIINGSADWVYEEELYLTRTFSWSPDGQKIAYTRTDERGVKEFNMQMWPNGSLYPYDYRFKYPKAGEENAIVDVYVYHLEGEKQVRIRLDRSKEYYVARLKWTKDPNTVSLQLLNRLQNERSLYHASADNGQINLILSEKSDTYVDLNYCDELTYLKDKKHFLYSSEESGYKHLYLYTLAGKRVRAITQGQWEVISLEGIDEQGRNPVLYYVSTEGSPLERHLYRTDITGKTRRKLTRTPGVHYINFSSTFDYYLDYYSNARTPLQVVLYNGKENKQIRVLEDNKALLKASVAHGFAKKEFFTFPTRDGQLLHGYVLKPKDFNSSQAYPVWVYQYSGPGSQNVRNEWGGAHYVWHQMLAQLGYLVVAVDTRGTGGRGSAFTRLTYAQLGRYEAEDLVETAKYLNTLPYVDKNRIGLWGWSYGGYMTSLVLFTEGANYYKAGIAVAPVSNWRLYDTIYTERYQKRPQDNPSGYDDYSPITHVEGLKGEYLLIHGTGDDNVHFQNAIVLQEALIAAGKNFESFYYPNKAHALSGKSTRTHLYKLMTRFIQNKL